MDQTGGMAMRRFNFMGILLLVLMVSTCAPSFADTLSIDAIQIVQASAKDTSSEMIIDVPEVAGSKVGGIVQMLLNFALSPTGSQILMEIGGIILVILGSTKLGKQVKEKSHALQIDRYAERVAFDLNENIVEPLKAANADGYLSEKEKADIRASYEDHLKTVIAAEAPHLAKQLANTYVPIIREKALGVLKARFKR